MKKSQLTLALGLAGMTMLTGCNDSSSSDTDTSVTQSTTYSVKAIDGYLRGAIVWLDINNNYQLDAGEPFAESGEGGVAELDVSGIDDPGKYSLVVQTTEETIDEDTITEENPEGTPVETAYVMSAPAGETVVTPLSTKVNLVLEQKKAEAEQSDSTTELTDEEIEALKQEAVNEVAGEDLDPELVLGDYVAIKTVSDDASDEEIEAAKEAARIAYEAKVIVQSKQLPQDPEALKEAVEEIQTDPNSSSLLDKLHAVSEQIQKAIEEKKKEAESDDAAENMDFDTLALPDFVEDSDKVNDLTDDNDNDGIANAFDAFPENASEWLDTDGDGIGNNSDTDIDGDGFDNDEDALPLNAKEWLDTDDDGLGNNADSDDDNDGVADDDDAFPLDKDETSDLDKDGIGDNADTDDSADTDGSTDTDDSTDIDDSVDSDDSADNDDSTDTSDSTNSDNTDDDTSESTDADNGNSTGDDTGDTTGSDDSDSTEDGSDDSAGSDTDDGTDDSTGSDDGVDDSTDTDGSTDTDTGDTTDSAVLTDAEFIQFISDTGALYEFDSDKDDYSNDTLFVDTFVLNGNLAQSSGFREVLSDGTLGTISEDDDDIILTDTGWVKLASLYTIDISGETAVAYPTEYSEIQYSLESAKLIDLDGEMIADIGEHFWETYYSTTAQFPSGSKLIEFDAIPAQDIYYLWEDSQVWANNAYNDYGDEGYFVATSLDQLISDTAATGTLNYSNTKVVYLGYSGIGVELVDDGSGTGGTANYYDYIGESGDASGYFQKVGSSTWTISIQSGEEILEFTVPEDARSAFGEYWDHDSATILMSAYDGKVRMGELQHGGLDEDSGDILHMFNETAYEAIMAQLDLTSTYDDSSTDDSGEDSTDADTDSAGDDSSDYDSGYYDDGYTDSDSDGSSEDDYDEYEEDRSALAENVGTTTELTDAQFIDYVVNSGGLYEFDKESDYDSDTSFLTVSAFVLNGDTAQSQGFSVVTANNTVVSIGEEEKDDLILVDGSWVTPVGYTMNITGEQAYAYPTGYSEIRYSLDSAKVVDLEGVAISDETLGFWSDFQSDSAAFPSGSSALLFTPVAQQDIYSLWEDSEVWISLAAEPWSRAADNLAELVNDTAAVNPDSSNDMTLIYIGWNIGVELVANGSANFYKQSDTTYEMDMVGSTTWLSNEIGGKTVYQLTVTDEAIEAFGDKWEDSPATLLFAEHEGGVIRGAVETAEDSSEHVVTMFNQTAYSAILSEVEISDGEEDGDI